MSETGRFSVAGIDQKARDMAREALANISAHERVCAERAREAATWRAATTEKLDDMSATFSNRLTTVDHAVSERMGNMSKAVTTLSNRMWASTIGLIGLLVTICGYLIAHKGL